MCTRLRRRRLVLKCASALPIHPSAAESASQLTWGFMIQLIYASAAAKEFTAPELDRLLERARLRNDLYSVTGMLLYHDGSFLQVVEGPESSIETIYESISRDTRHLNPKILLRQTISRREFSNWSMGFADTSHSFRRPDGFVDYYRTLPTLTDASSRAAQYLRFFQAGLCRETSNV